MKMEGKKDKIKMIFSDIDGTLLNSNHQVTAATRAKILQLETEGVPFVLVSARPPAGVQLVQNQLGTSSPAIYYSGALVEQFDHQILASTYLEQQPALDIYLFIKREFPEICVNLYAGRDWIVNDAGNHWVTREADIIKAQPTGTDIETYLQTNEGIHKYLLMGDPEPIRRLEQAIKGRFDGLTVATSNENYLEVMNEQVKKSAGVKLLCEHYGCTLDEVLVFGDGMNDVDMLQAVTHSYAMANAVPEVKAHAAFEAEDNDHDGLLHVLEEYFQ